MIVARYIKAWGHLAAVSMESPSLQLPSNLVVYLCCDLSVNSKVY